MTLFPIGSDPTCPATLDSPLSGTITGSDFVLTAGAPFFATFTGTVSVR